MKNYILAILWLSTVCVSASTLLLEPFEAADGVTTGPVNGQHGWLSDGGTTADIQSGMVQSGSQALEIREAQVSNSLYSSNSTVWVEFYARISALPETPYTLTNGNTVAAFCVDTNGYLVVYDGTSPIVSDTQMPLNTWTRFNLYCNWETSKWALYINGTNVANGLSFFSSISETIANISIANNSTNSAYFDSINIVDKNVASLPFTETFETANNITAGSVDGQRGWVVHSGTATVQSNMVQSGVQSLYLQDADVSYEIADAGSPAAWQQFYIRPGSGSGQQPDFSINPNAKFALYVDPSTSSLVAYSNQTPVELNVHIPSDRWTRLDIYCDYDAGNWCVSVNGTNVASQLAFYSDSDQPPPLTVYGSGYVDYITVSDNEPVSNVPDSNHDGIPDWWQQKYMAGATNGDVNAVSANSGMTYLQAYVAGLRPDINDPFIATGISQGHGLQWSPKYGRLYDVEWSTNLLAGFTPIATDIPWTESEFIDDSSNTNKPAGFYRLKAHLE